jgi:hypothetical protein
MFGIYVAANIWAAPRGSRRARKWIDEVDLDDATDLADAVHDVADPAAPPAHEELVAHDHHDVGHDLGGAHALGDHDLGGHDVDHSHLFDAIGHLFDHL